MKYTQEQIGRGFGRFMDKMEEEYCGRYRAVFERH